ncbi:MAG TPA: carboxypeptidase regulatory-like domain-containing protein [Blastocatellia bacterium]|nr:carboxypeptidase regulatory-like domain-containing protein [Blastocatellia bacterium]
MLKRHLLKLFRPAFTVACATLLLLNSVGLVVAQQTTGNIRGTVKDESGGTVAGVSITAHDKMTNNSFTTQSSSTGDFEFKNLPVGQYELTLSATGFKSLTLTEVAVQLNQTTNVAPVLNVGQVNESINVSAGGSELVDTSTTNLAKGFEARQVVDLPQTGKSSLSTGISGIYNLALNAPNVVTTGGVGVGTGGSVGGQRARNNNFVVDGVDNNDKSVTGPQVYISPEAVSEFSLLANQYGAEFARSTGGQFITVTRSGTNSFHGSAYAFILNRHLNALDTQQKAQGITRDTDISNPNSNPRFDNGRFGGNLGGPILKNKLFFFGMYERTQQGSAGGAGAIETPTAAGFSILDSIPGLSSTNLGVMKQFVPAAPAQSGTDSINVAGRTIPIGFVNIPSPAFAYNNYVQANIDFTQTDRTQHRGRFTYNQTRGIDTCIASGQVCLPQFFELQPLDSRLFSYTLLHTFTPTLTNETRIAYRRYSLTTPAGNHTFPGLDQFPNVGLLDLGAAGVNIGPDPNGPAFTIENNYQIVNDVSYLWRNHSFKVGGDFRKSISPQQFVQRSRGDYQYNTTELFLRDLSPDHLGERNVGLSPYYGNQKILFIFGQDDWHIKPNLTLNLGLNYVYQEVPFGAKQQTLNSIASVPGVLEFNEPESQKSNFGPRIGVAYSPDFADGWLHTLLGSGNRTSIRAGFSMAYDVIFDNIYILSSPPQMQQTIDVPDLNNQTPNFLASGGILPVLSPVTDPVATRAATSAWIPDQKVPYSITYTLSYQRQFARDWGMELRYLGTRGVHLLTQNRINRQAEVTANRFLPTFFSTPSSSELSGLPTFNDLFAGQSNFVPRFDEAGFNGSNVVAFLPNGNSNYNAFSAQVSHRYAHGLQMSAAYTWSHLIDDTTAEVFSTVLSPRRVEDFQNLSREKATSALDHRHRFVLSGIYDVPLFRDGRRLWRSIAGGWSLAGTLAFESGEMATVQSGIDSNLNGDSAGDRSIINLAGVKGTSTAVHAVNRNGTTVPLGSSTAVAYVADNSNAQYIQAGPGARTNAGRNTLQLPGIANLDFAIFKNFRITESMKVQFRVDLYNAFNHAQFVPGSINGVELTSQTAVLGLLKTGSAQFNQPDQAFSSHPRIIQFGLRFNF